MEKIKIHPSVTVSTYNQLRRRGIKPSDVLEWYGERVVGKPLEFQEKLLTELERSKKELEMLQQQEEAVTAYIKFLESQIDGEQEPDINKAVQEFSTICKGNIYQREKMQQWGHPKLDITHATDVANKYNVPVSELIKNMPRTLLKKAYKG